MGSSLTGIIACLALLCNHRGIALKCYECSDFYVEDGETNPNCRAGIDNLTPTECPPPEGGTIVGMTAVCIKEVGTLKETVNLTTVEKGEIVRRCVWLPQGQGIPTNQCFASDGAEPLQEVSYGNSEMSEIIDIYVLCVCSADACNSVGVLHPLCGPVRLAVMSSLLVVLKYM